MKGFSFKTFCVKLRAQLQLDESLDYTEYVIDEYLRGTAGSGEGLNVKLTRIANAAADALQDMKTPGSEFLYLVDEPDKAKQKKELGNLADKCYAAKMADFSIPSCAVKPQQHH